ncbi:methyltransferase [Nitrospina sp. 32_T5]|uniref:methyltransferase n=1 Tax=unclassified Nitrospina TaxID=2638683 RepID=UPI003F9D8811
MTDPVRPDKIMQMGLGFWGSKVLLSAVELGVFTLLGKDSYPLETLSEKTGLHSRSAHDFFDTLVALGLLHKADGFYSNTAETVQYLDRSSPYYIGGFLEMANSRLYRFWGDLTLGLKTGLPQNEIKHGEPGLFEAVYGDPAKLKEFLRAMTGLSMGANVNVAAKFPFEKYKTFIDVGGAQGGLPVQVALKHPHITGGNFDLPVVQPVFDEYVASFQLSDRLHFFPGNFFEDDLPTADVLSMGHILHDWDLNEKHTLIRKAYDALPEGGALIVVESIIDDERRENAFGLLMSLNMLIETPGGFDFTGADCCGWMEQAGFQKTEVVHLAGPDSMVIGFK